jgi:thioredoxin 1
MHLDENPGGRSQVKMTDKWILSCALVFMTLTTAHGDTQPFSDAAFREAQVEQRPVLIDVYASWCPTCRRQGQILETLLEEDEFAELVVYKLDWDAQREIARGFGAPRQSTLIVYRGEEERGRLVADTRPDAIRNLLLMAVRD